MKTFELISDGKKRLKVIYNDSEFFFSIPPVDSEDASLIDNPKQYTYEEDGFTIFINLFLEKIEVFSNIEDEDIDFFVEDAKEIEEERKNILKVPVYVPIFKYTSGTNKIIDTILEAKSEQKVIVPLFDIKKKSNLDQYKKDNIQITHFLDLCKLQYVSNIDQKEIAKEQRKRYRQQYGTLDGAPDIPEDELKKFSMDEIIKLYSDIKTDFIPVCHISTKEQATLDYARYVLALYEKFNRVALRVIDLLDFEKNFESYLLPLVGKSENIYIILECNKNSYNDIDFIYHIKKFDQLINIVYVRETTDFDSNKLIINEINILTNKSLNIYENITMFYADVWYGDYLGYDRDTAIEYIPAMKPNASLYLLSSDAKEIAILKIKDDSEKGTSKTKLSMKLLKSYLPKLDNSFFGPNHCNGCERIAKEPLNLKKAKQFCQMHNGIVLANI